MARPPQFRETYDYSLTVQKWLQSLGYFFQLPHLHCRDDKVHRPHRSQVIFAGNSKFA